MQSQCVLPRSQVPQPTCSWKWVGVTLPLKVTNFSLQPSSMDNCGRAWPVGCLLDSSTPHEATRTVPLFVHSLVFPPALHFYPPPDRNFCWRHIFHLDFSFLAFVFLTSSNFAFVSDDTSVQLKCISFGGVVLVCVCANFYRLWLWPACKMQPALRH